MRDPVGVLRNLFFRLYSVCFETDMLGQSREEVILRVKRAPGIEDFVILFSLGVDDIRETFQTDIPTSAGMMFADPEGSVTSFIWESRSGARIEGESKKRYVINTNGIRSGYHRFVRTKGVSARDAAAIHEVNCVALAAHEIRHEFQFFGVVPENKWHTVLPFPKETRLTASKKFSEKGNAAEYRRYLKMYGKRCYDNRKLLAMEVDAISVQCQSYYAWIESRGRPLEKRLQGIRDVIFSEA